MSVCIIRKIVLPVQTNRSPLRFMKTQPCRKSAISSVAISNCKQCVCVCVYVCVCVCVGGRHYCCVLECRVAPYCPMLSVHCSMMKSPSLTTVVDGRNKTLYMPVSVVDIRSALVLSTRVCVCVLCVCVRVQTIPSIEEATRPNLDKKLTGVLCDY